MPRLAPFQGLLLNLEGKIEPGSPAYLPKEDAYGRLKQWTGQDFHYDVQAWRTWLKEHKMH